MNLSELAIRRPIFILCVVFFMLVTGFMSLKKMPVDQFPDVTFPIVSVYVRYPGASPLDLEREVSKKIEDEISSLAGLDTLTSNNYEGVAIILAKFRLGTDVKDVEQQIRNRVGNIRSDLPADITEPVIRRFDPADQPIMSLVVVSDMDPGELFDIVDERVKPAFERLPDVGQVEIFGGRKREVRVYVDRNKLQDRELSMIQVAQRIEQTSKDVPIGKVDNVKNETSLRTSGEFTSFEDLKDVAVSFLGSDRPVKLKEIGDVIMSLEDPTRLSSVNGKNALSLAVYKQSGANTVAVADRVGAAIGSTNAILKERGINAEVKLIRDGALPIRMNVADVYETIIIGIVLCVIVVFFFLGSARSTFITGMALPNSLLGGFIIMYASGFSINVLTLLALSLAVGLLIDDAIVVRENIFRHMEMGKSPRQAAIDGTKEVALAVIATTFVVIAVFGPIAFVPGMIGQFFKQFGLTVVFTMLISLLDAFTVAPMLSAHLAAPNEHVRGKGFMDRVLNQFDRFQTWLENIYEKALIWALNWKKTVLAGAFFLFVFSIALVGFIPKTFLPPNELGEFTVSVEMPVGTSLEGTDAFTRKIEDKLKTFPEVQMVLKTVGNSQLEANKADFFVQLVPSKQRKFTTTQMKTRVREAMDSFGKEANIAVGDYDISGGGQKPFNMFIVGDDLKQVTEYSEKVRDRLRQIKDLADVDTNFRSGKPEFRVIFDRARSESLGVSTAQAGLELRYRTEGAEAATYRQGGQEYKIRARLREDQRDLEKNFSTTLVPNTNFNMIPLPRIAKGENAFGYSQINRQNKGRYIAITANMAEGGKLGDATTEVERLMKGELKPPVGVEYRFEGMAQDFQDLIANMLIAMGLGVLFIYFVLASLYESFITPFTILLALPLAISGATASLFITGKTIDIFSIIGMVMLLGVVAKNSILLVDYTLHVLREEKLPRREALIRACRTRLRPILMTSFALIAGTLPIAIGLSELGAQRMSMGIAIIGGVASSTLLTLIVVPAAFGYIEDFNQWMLRTFRRLTKKVDMEESHAPHHAAEEARMTAQKPDARA
ncbi:MAG: efflux RND transporter permease subunit [Bdellovibrionaceae bacterium]|nr:efflux RND transporter permease subunit [Pseudobdellovibrionaceae bacterium]MBX3034717.1 efflux RND transporter permease subunit [Pseudobdellovibrionaceae bacterium]